MKLLLLMCTFFSSVVFCGVGEREFVRLPGPDGYELVAYRSTKFGPIEYTAKVFFNQNQIAHFVDCADDYENPTLFKLKCLHGDESLDLEIHWGNASTATQMHGTWLAGERHIPFFKIDD